MIKNRRHENFSRKTLFEAPRISPRARAYYNIFFLGELKRTCGIEISTERLGRKNVYF